jgi:catechol-2,3-dioxygenase
MSGIPVTGVSELVLAVQDLEQATRFYADVLGFPIIGRSERRRWVIAGERTRIGLWLPQLGLAAGRGGSHVHFALHVGERDFDDAVARLSSYGYEPELASFEDDDRGRAAYVTDPDGNVVELWTFDVRRHLEQVA